MKLTTNHSTSRYGTPVFVDQGAALDYADGIARLRRQLNITQRELAAMCGVSRRTAEGWEQGRMPSREVLYRMMELL